MICPKTSIPVNCKLFSFLTAPHEGEVKSQKSKVKSIKSPRYEWKKQVKPSSLLPSAFCPLSCFLTAISIISCLTLSGFPVLAEKFYSRFTLFQPSAYTNYPYRGSKSSISDTLTKNKKFATFLNELKEANLLDMLKRPGHFIIFAPTDDAFNALPDNVLKRYRQPENRMKVLKYHLISNKITSEQLNGGVITTIEGSQIKITDTPEGTIKLNDANAKYPPTMTTNGMIIEIDKVLLPSDF